MATKPARPDSQAWLDSRTLGLGPLPQPALSAGEPRAPRQSSLGPADPRSAGPRATNCLVRSPDRYHQAAQHHAHGYVKQPTHLHTNAPHHCLPRTGSDRDGPCPAGSYQHSRTGRYLMPEPILRPQEVGPKRGCSQRVPTALPFSTRLSTICLPEIIRFSQGTLPKALGPVDNEPCGPKRPHVVAPGTARRQGRSPEYPMSLNRSVFLSRAGAVVAAPAGESTSDRFHQSSRMHTTCQMGGTCRQVLCSLFTDTNAVLRSTACAAPQAAYQSGLLPDMLELRDLSLLRHEYARHSEHEDAAARAGVNQEMGRRPTVVVRGRQLRRWTKASRNPHPPTANS